MVQMNGKVHSLKELGTLAPLWKAEGKRVVLCHGTFDVVLCHMSLMDMEDAQEAVREATDRRFPAERLGRHLALLRSNVAYDQRDHLNEIRRLLAIAWARNSDFERLQLVVRATDALPGKSKTAFRLLQAHAESIAVLECDTRQLAEAAE